MHRQGSAHLVLSSRDALMCRRVAWSGQSTDQDRVIDPGMLGQAKESWMHWIFGIGAVTRGTRVRDATSTLPGPPLLVQTCSERVNTTLAAGGLGSTPQWCNTHAAAHDGQGLPPSKLIHPQSRFMFLYSLLSMVTAPSPSRLTAAPPLQRVAQVSLPDSSPRSLMKALLRGQVLLLYVAIVVQAGPINFLADVRYQLWHLGQSNQLAGSSLWSQPALLLCWQSAVVK